MKEPVRVALIGIAGYGSVYVNQVLDIPEKEGIVPVAALARRPERCSRLDELKARGARVYSCPEDFFRDSNADLVIISSPIHLHAPFTCLALDHGANVLCEKPTAPTIQEALRMLDAERKAVPFTRRRNQHPPIPVRPRRGFHTMLEARTTAERTLRYPMGAPGKNCGSPELHPVSKPGPCLNN